MDYLWLALLEIALLFFLSGVHSFWKRKAMSTAYRGTVAVSSLFLAIVLFLDSGSYAMVPNVGPCLTLLGKFLLPLGEGVAVSARYLEFFSSFALAAFALKVALRKRKPRIVERGEPAR